MKKITPLELRTNIDQILGEVLQSGLPVEIMTGNRRLRIVVVENTDKLQALTLRPDVIQGDPEDLVTLSWEGDASLELP